MPTYEFRCPDGTIVERSFKISEAPDAIPAPDGSGMAVRIMSAGAGLVFKGSGFYITDYGKDGKKDQRADASRGAEGTATDGAKPDAIKPESVLPTGAKAEGSKSDGAKPAAAPDASSPSAPRPADSRPAGNKESPKPAASPRTGDA